MKSRFSSSLLKVVLAIVLAELCLVWPLDWVLTHSEMSAIFADVREVVRGLAWVFAAGLTVVMAGLHRPSDDLPPETVASQRWLWGALDDLSEGIVAFGRDGRVVFANLAARNYLDRPVLPPGTPMIAFADIPSLRTSLGRALLDRESVSVTLESRGRRVLQATCTPAAGDGALLLIVDVTETRDALRTREAFLSDSAHELRTPLTAVIAGAEALSEVVEEPAQASLLAGMRRQGRRLQQLIDDLLALSQLDAGVGDLSLTALDVAIVVEGATERVGADPRVIVKPGGAAEIIVDVAGMERVLTNLMQNALRYAPGQVELSWTVESDAVKFRVDDDGPGIPESERERVFERFYRLDGGRSRDAGGTGLGLPITRRLVERFDGSIRLLESPAGGTRAEVTIPRVVPRT